MRRLLALSAVGICLAVSLLMPRAGQAAKQAEQGVRFAPVDIYLDSGSTPLAAYQFELVCSVPARASVETQDLASPRSHYAPQIKIVGVEGGEHPAFAEAPYYDPAALMNDRIIIAAFNTGDGLPTGRTRIATIHLEILGDAEPQYEVKLITAADPEGNEFLAPITHEKGEQK